MTLARPSRATTDEPARFAASQRRAFTDNNLHVRGSSVVHAVDWVDWTQGLRLPAPSCRQAFGGHGFHGELRPTRWPVTCRRCRRLRDKPLTHDQPALFPLPT